MERVNPANRRSPSIIETERLLLRRPRIEDAFDLFHLALGDEAFARATVGDQPLTLEAACTAVVRMLADSHCGSGAWWIVVEKDSNQVVGLTGFTHRATQLGPINALANTVLGKGYARETVEALINFGLVGDRLHPSEEAMETEDIAKDDDSLIPSRWYWHCKATRLSAQRPRCGA